MFRPAAHTYGSEWNKVTYFSSRYHLIFPRAKDQNSIFISHPLCSNLLSFLHFSFMNMFISITMLIANFSFLLSCLISLTCGQLFIRGGEPLNLAITKLHASVPPVHTGWALNSLVRTAPPVITSPNVAALILFTIQLSLNPDGKLSFYPESFPFFCPKRW